MKPLSQVPAMTHPLAALALLALTAAGACGGAMAPPPSVALRVALADAVLVGQVTAIADKVESVKFSRDDNRTIKFATVKVETVILGKIGSTAQVGFVVYQGEMLRRFPVPQLTKGQEALLILMKHPAKKGAYVLANYYDAVAVLDKKAFPNFKPRIDPIAEAKRAVQALRSPLTSLKAKKAEDRLFAASVLLTRYKTPAAGSTKTEPVPAAESKLILDALAGADWSAPDAGAGWGSPHALFYQLGLTAKDGWSQPQDFKQIAPAAKKWLKANSATYKMTRFVRDKATVEPSEEP